MLYANYIRNKMHHLVKSVFASGYPLKIISKFKKKAVNYTIHGKTQIGKNLIPYPYINTTKTTNGVTYTDNGDGSVTVSGTATGYSDFFFKIMSIAPNTTFTFSKNQSDDAANVAFTLRQLDENRALIGTEISLVPTVATHTFTTAENARYIQIACKRYANAECKGTYKPMLELGDTATEYEKYTVYGVGDKTKNLIPYPYSGFGGEKTKIINGITFTDNGGGLITLNGTATADVEFNFTGDFVLPPGNFQISINHDYQDFYLGLNEREGNPDKNGNYIVYCALTVSKGVTINNGTCRPQIELGNTATDYEPYGYKIPLVNRGKNLIPYPYANTTKTVNGVTFTDNGDGSITVNGTATDKVWYPISTRSASTIYATKGIYTISGCPSGGSGKTYYLNCNIYNGTTNVTSFWDSGNGNTKDLNSYTFTTISVNLGITKDTVCNNLVFKPMLEIGNTATEYEPYRAPDTTNVYHTALLKDGESISYKADGLPELQLYKGENNITADTAVAPSVIDIKYLN